MATDDDFLAALDNACIDSLDYSLERPVKDKTDNEFLCVCAECVEQPDFVLRLRDFSDSALLRTTSGDYGVPPGSSGLHLLLRRGRSQSAIAFIEYILETASEPVRGGILGRQNSSGETSLMIAAEKGYYEVARRIAPYEAGKSACDLAIALENGHKPSSWLYGRTALYAAVQNGHTDIALLLAPSEQGVVVRRRTMRRNVDRTKVIFQEYNTAWDLLCNGSIRDDSDKQRDALRNALEYESWIALCLNNVAARSTAGFSDIEILRDKYAWRPNFLRQTSLMFCCMTDNIDMLAYLVASLANSVRSNDKLVRGYMQQGSFDVFGNSALHYAIVCGSRNCAQFLSGYSFLYVFRASCLRERHTEGVRMSNNMQNLCREFSYKDAFALSKLLGRPECASSLSSLPTVV